MNANVVQEGMMIKGQRFHCPCCGWPGLLAPAYAQIGPPPWKAHGVPPYEAKYGDPSYDVCSCCGFEFGNDDNPGTGNAVSFHEHLRQWIGDGCKWFREQEKPRDWDLEGQLTLAQIKT